jgi:ribosome biogenesis GTPase
LPSIAVDCRYSDCAHESEPGCAVRAAVEGGGIDPRRFESYRKLTREAIAGARRADEAAKRAYEKKFGKMVKRATKTKKRRGES